MSMNEGHRVPSQQGIVLLDALVAILIFSIGILGMVNLQAAATKLAGDAKYRTDAAMLADQVIAQMWTSDPTAISTNFAGAAGTGGTRYTDWAATLDCKSATASTSCLPAAATYPPSIVVGANNLVTVTVYWKAPNDTGSHNYVSITQISR